MEILTENQNKLYNSFYESTHNNQHLDSKTEILVGLSAALAMNSKRLRVAVIGNSRWCARMEDMMALSAADVRHLYPGEEAILRQRSVTDWLGDRHIWGYDLIHCIGWFTFWGLWVAARLRRKPTIHHWIGSDVFALCQAGFRGHVAGRMLNHLVGCHLAVADHLVVELGRQGIKAMSREAQIIHSLHPKKLK